MRPQRISQRRISLVAGSILLAVTVLVGAMVFFVMQRHAENLLRGSLQSSLQHRAERTRTDIQAGFDKIATSANRPFMIDQLELVDQGLDDGAALDGLKRYFVPAVLQTGISAVAIFRSDGREVAHGGVFAQRPELAVSLNLPGRSRLLWKDRFLLHGNVEILKGGRLIGRLVAEAPLPATARTFKTARSLGATGEQALCASAGENMRCFPMTLNPRPMTLAKRSAQGVPLPMTHALEGRTGFIAARDYRQQDVVAAYGPVGDLGLGMVLKMDSAELYAPVWGQLRYLLPLMTGAVIIALLLLRWQLTPLVARLVRSERNAREAFTLLHESESRVQAVVENVSEGIVTVSGATGEIELFNPGAEAIFGYRAADVIGKHIAMLMPEPYRSNRTMRLDSYLRTDGSRPAGAGREVAAQRGSGEVFPMELRLSEFYLEGRRQFIGTMRDITERKAAEATIVHLAHYDALTDLPNRLLVQDRIQLAIASARRASAQFAVLFIDLDKFKSINDSHGHAMGDRLLQMVAQRLGGALRAEDTVGRQGGDEFIVVLPRLAAAEDSAVVAKKILALLSAPFVVDGRELRTGASIGIAVYPQDGSDVDTLLKHSDTAMYHAKEAGRNSYHFFAQAMNATTAERLLLENSLRQAIENDELLLHYQPLVNIADGGIVATEALVRWNHPQLGPVGPARFIPVAEDSGLIVPLGEWVLRRACSQLRQWREQGIELRRMVINLSPRQFRQKDLVQTFSRVLSETGVDPCWLGLEITEGVIMEKPEASIAVLRELKTMGIELSLDDFGTGYSSLSYLKRLPIDKLKIDQSFVREITTDADDAAMVAAIIVMAHQLNIRVVAEGVETEAQLAFLREHGCDEYQGYLFSRPVPAEALRARFQGHRP